MPLKTRYDEQPAAWVLPAIIVGILVTFLADCATPLGYAVWMFYLAPVALTHYAVEPKVAVRVGLVCSALLLAGFAISSPNAEALPFAKFNRSLGFVMIWTIAALTHRVNTGRALVRKQEWIQRALSELSAVMQGHASVKELGEGILAFLARYLDAHAGLVYLDDGQKLQSVASLALAPEEARTFWPGEGLVGRAVQERRALEIRELQPNYLNLRSGLGATQPGALLVLPLRAAGDSIGAVELAFLHPIYPEDRELLDSLSEPMGISLRVAEQQQKVRQLLAETQVQAEELQTQQEELRVANEELTQHGELQRAQASRLEEQQAELEQTNEQLAEQTTQLMEQRDALALTQADLQRKADELSAASQYKSEFLANMSHELRTPLNSALILSKLLADNTAGNLNAEQVQFARNIHTAGNDLLELINDILDLSKVEAGKMEVVLDHVVPRRVLSTLQETFEPLAAQKKLKLTISAAEECPARIETDSQRLRQILRNLLANAIKFTEQGEVSLRVFPVGESEVAFEVRDTGIGIAPDQHAVIFEAFQQASGGTSRKYGGTGLGLTISREFARLLGGRLALESELGKGTAITLILPTIYQQAQTTFPTPTKPVAPAAPRLARPAAPVSSARTAHVSDDRGEMDERRRTVLVIEDDPVFATLLRDLARELGFAALVTDSADQGFELAQQNHPAAILLDVKLVDHSGLTVLDRAKRSPALRHIPIHVMSAENHTQRALEMGAATYMLKPVMREQLVSVLSELHGDFGRVRRVLVAEDNPIDRESICSLLRSEQVETVPVESVAETFRELKQNTYDCLVLDLALSDGSGLTLLEKMSEEQAHSFPPTVIYTGRVLSAEEELRLRSYSSAVIIKGARSPERLLDEVTLFLHQVEASLPAERQRMLEAVRSREALFEDRSVLIVEDDVRNIFALTSVLEPKRVKLRIARNGREALAILDGESAFDMILMDIMMPEMDGLTAMREIRKRPGLSSIPIIALTAKAMRDDMLQCLQAGANDYIAKPLDIEKLLSLMRVWMPRRSQLPIGLLERV